MTVRDLIKEHEGLKLEVYRCPTGYLSVGYGHNIEANGLSISLQKAEQLLDADIRAATAGAARTIANFWQLDEVRQAVIISMIFQLGEEGFKKFKKTIAWIEVEDFAEAGKEMLDSLWAQQTEDRAKELQAMMTSGKWPK